MRSLRFLSAFVALIAALGFVVACGGGEPDPQSSWTGTDEDSLPDGARDVIEGALETMFTWYPTTDTSTRDAYERASEYLTPELAAANHSSERGTSVWWDEWKAADASVIADALVVLGEHPKDSEDAVERAVMLNQKVTAPDGAVLEDSDMRVDRVAAVKQGDDWRVSLISFFPDLPTQAPPPPECAEGEQRLQPPSGLCVPIPQVPSGPGTQPQEQPGSPGPQQPGSPGPAPQPQQPGAPGPASPGPGTPNTGTRGTPCPNGTTVSPGETCPTDPQPMCADGSPPASDGSCPTDPGTTRCPDGSTVAPGQPCLPTVYPCWDGSWVELGQPCPIPQIPDEFTCWDGTVVDSLLDCRLNPDRDGDSGGRGSGGEDSGDNGGSGDGDSGGRQPQWPE